MGESVLAQENGGQFFEIEVCVKPSRSIFGIWFCQKRRRCKKSSYIYMYIEYLVNVNEIDNIVINYILNLL